MLVALKFESKIASNYIFNLAKYIFDMIFSMWFSVCCFHREGWYLYQRLSYTSVLI